MCVFILLCVCVCVYEWVCVSIDYSIAASAPHSIHVPVMSWDEGRWPE